MSSCCGVCGGQDAEEVKAQEQAAEEASQQSPEQDDE